MWEAWCAYTSNANDSYSFESLVLAHVQMIFAMAVRLLEKFRPECYPEFSRIKPGDLMGADLFATGLAACVNALRNIHRVGYNGTYEAVIVSEADRDILEQTTSYIARSVQNAMREFLREMFPSVWTAAKRVSFRYEDDLTDASGRPLFTTKTPLQELIEEEEESRGTAAVRAACTEPLDFELLQMKAEGEFSETEMGKIVGSSRDQVHRDFQRIFHCIERSLGLTEKKSRRRKHRKPRLDDAETTGLPFLAG